VAAVVRRALAAPPAARRIAALSPREHEVLALLAQGRSNAEIAAALVLSERTIESHVRSVYGKLGLDDTANRRVAAARIWHDGRP
ncbi:MAG TPA: helix-turn-helix transcriptional regulator, partial [Rhodoglobus sp.]|nr:helix-turn-helix transcriptional regulator [Rhodoglobus sp.]